MNEAVACRKLEKTYDSGGKEFRVLKGLDFSVSMGEYVAVVGPSGAGKSTLLHIIGAIDRPTGGKVYFDGVDLDRVSERKLAELRNVRVGFVFQFYHLLPEFSALENVVLPSMIAGARPREKRERARELLERVGLGGFEDKYCFELSGGEMQRVAICRALINNPDVILADEPTGNLDSENSSQIMRILAGMNANEKKTLVIATHDRTLADSADRVVAITDGKLTGQNREKNKWGLKSS